VSHHARAIGPAPRRTRSVSAAGLVWATVMVGGVLVWQPQPSSSSAARDTPKYSLASDSMSLTDDDSGTALFTASSLKPGSSGARCIVVRSPAGLASTVRLYSTGYRTTKGLGDYLHVVIEEGTGGSFGTPGSDSCAGFRPGGSAFTGTLAAFATTRTSFATGVSGWAPTGTSSASRTYRFAFTLDPATPNSAQSGTAAAGLTWELQNS
jgi:hypothetical protein